MSCSDKPFEIARLPAWHLVEVDLRANPEKLADKGEQQTYKVGLRGDETPTERKSNAN